ncbi:MAG: DUF2085 domain-containing protein [Deltaproteobacteria bacterium]|nr:DUF2085 domain-containing protein [Deltaproteobacteria bacterium]
MLEFIASLVCHQVPERTLTIGGGLLPLCARCTGIYSGFLIGVVFQIIVDKKVNRLPSIWITTVSIVLILALTSEVLGEKLRLWELPNEGRLLTGLFCGSALSVISFPLLNYFLQKDGENEASIGSGSYVGLLVFVGLFFGLHYVSSSFFILSSFSVVGILVCYAAINLTIAGMVVNWKMREFNFRRTLVITSLVLTMFIGETVVLRMIG